MKEIFEHIIKTHYWADVPCGSGSTVEFTELFRNTLPVIFKEYNITSMLDLPCGDHSWMSLVEFPKNFAYIGADIVEFMIEQNRVNYPGKDFRVMDLSIDPLPAVDLLLCRDCLFHLDEVAINNVFRNIADSKIQYVLTTSYLLQYSNNININTGNFRPINLELEPFNLPEPIARFDDGIPGNIQRQLCLWRTDQIATTI